jgi:FkbM family methyltransferase
MSRIKNLSRQDLSFVDNLFGYFNRIKSQAKNFLLIRKAFLNYTSLLIANQREAYPVKAITRNSYKDGKILVSSFEELLLLAQSNVKKGLKYDPQHDMLTINRELILPTDGDENSEPNIITICGCRSNGDIISVFIEAEYEFLPVKGKTVIDVGANIGDSCIYFSLKGAERVIGLEPFPVSYNLAIRNIELNNLSQKVDVLLAGLGTNTEDLHIDPTYTSNSGSHITHFDSGIVVPLMTLSQILDKFGLSSKEIVLKIDCEGCEYDSVMTSSEDLLRTFSHIQIEYHRGYKKLKQKLEDSGFKVFCRRPVRLKGGDLYLGFIYATRE